MNYNALSRGFRAAPSGRGGVIDFPSRRSTTRRIHAGITHHNPEGLWFRRQAEVEGFKSAVEWRDSRRPIPEGDEARALIAELDRRRAG